MRKTGLSTVAVVLMVLLAIVAVGYGKADAQEARMVRIYSFGQPGGTLSLEPDTAWIPKGTVVIWTNFARTGQVRIKFAEGKKCSDVTAAPSGFKLDALDCFVTTYLPFAGTSSLEFNQEGTYEYVVEAQGKEKKVTGKIIVQ